MHVDQMPLPERISALNFPAGHYALIGDSALAAHGLLDVHWIDLIVSPALFRSLPERGWAALPGSDGRVMTSGSATARSDLPNLSDRSAIDLIGDVDQVAGLPVVKLPILRQSVAAEGRSEDVHWRLSGIDQVLRRTMPEAKSPTRPRSSSGVAHLRGVLTAPVRTYVADRGRSFWGVAFVVGCVSTFLTTLIDVQAGEPGYVVLRTPVWAGISLLAQRGITGIARRVCGGRPDISSATASQAAIVMNGTTIPALAIGLLLPESLPSLVFVAVMVILILATLVVAFWLVGQLYSAAFGCSVGRGVVGELVGFATLVLVIFATLFVISGLLNV